MNLLAIEELIKLNGKDCIQTKQLLKQYYQEVEKQVIFRASENAENNVGSFIEAVQQRMQVDTSMNIYPLYKHIDKNVTTVNLNYYSVLNVLHQLSSITWQEFEDLCGILMRKCFGATETYVTQRTNDGGVDFEGKIPFKSNLVSNPYGWVEYFGQAKQYTGNVQRTDVDAFIAYASKKKRDYQYPAQLFIFCTSSDFNPSALKEIRKNNFIGLNGMQLATLVFAHSNQDNLNKNFVLEFMQS